MYWHMRVSDPVSGGLSVVTTFTCWQWYCDSS